MRRLKKFNCAVCGCESANFRDGGRYCQKCKLIYGHSGCLEIVTKRKNNPRLRVSTFFREAIASLSIVVIRRITKQLGGFPKTYDEQSELDAKRVKQAEKDANKRPTPRAQAKARLYGLKICACCGERFNAYDIADAKHCAVCRNVFGAESLRYVDKLSDSKKCDLYKIRRAKSNDEVKSMTPPELHQNLSPKLNIRLQHMNNVATMLMREKLVTQTLENEKHEKRPFTCCKCGETYLLEGEHPKPFTCDRCKVYDEEHEKGTKIRKLPGLPDMTYEHLALLPAYAACMFTKHMTAEELEKLKVFRAKVNPIKRTFSELISDSDT